MRRALLIASALSLALAGTSLAAPCRDGKGKYVKCPPAKSAPAARCKDAKGKFTKCGTPGARPV